MHKAIKNTLLEIVAIDSVSKNEQVLAAHLKTSLETIGLEVYQDEIGNVIGHLTGHGEPLLLNAHMDRVPPGKGHVAKVENEIMTSDGSTNLGADDGAGIAVCLEIVKKIVDDQLPHPPLVVLFTVQEEIGLNGAKSYRDKYGVKRGFAIDNAFEAGAVMGKGACYVAFDVEIIGKEAHPGADLSQGINVVSILLDTGIELGESSDGETRINIGSIQAGTARNIVPGKMSLIGEIRSFLQNDKLTSQIEKLRKQFLDASNKYDAKVVFTAKKLASAFQVDTNNQLLKLYEQVLIKRGSKLVMQSTYVASDANALNNQGMEIIPVSTGAYNYHRLDEAINLSELSQLAEDLLATIILCGSK